LMQFQRAIHRESHNLSRWPDLTVQQLANRLQWCNEDISRLAQSQTRTHDRPWIRMKAPFPESEGLVRIFRGHKNEVNACAVSPDGSFLVSGGGDRVNVVGAKPDYSLRVWDLKTGLERATLRNPDWPVTSCAVGPGGVIASGAQDGVTLWDPHTLSAVWRFPEGSFACSFSPDGTFMVIVGFVLSIIDFPSGVDRGSALCEGLVNDCAVSPDGAFVVTGGTDRHLAIWDTTSVDLVGDLILDEPSVAVTGCAVSPDGNLIAAATDAGDIVLWDPHTDARAVIHAHAGWATSCSFHPGGTLLVSTGDDALVKLWNLSNLEELAVLEGHGGEVTSCVFTPDGAACVTASADHTVRVWSLKGGSGRHLRRHTAEVVACQFSASDAIAVTVGARGDVYVHDAIFCRRREAWNAGTPIRSAGLSPDGEILAGACPDGSVRLWRALEGEPLGSLRHFPEGSGLPISTTLVRAWGWSPDGARVVSTAWRSLRVWDVSQEQEYTELQGHSGVLVGCLFTPDGTRVVSAGSDGSVRLWDTRTGALISVFETSPSSPVNDIALGPDGRWLAAAYTDRAVRTWDLTDDADPTVFRGHNDWVERCVVSPDGERIASAASDGSVLIWSRPDAKLIASLPGQESHSIGVSPSRLCFSPDGAWLAFEAGEGLIGLASTEDGCVGPRIPIPGMNHRLALHPARPVAIFTDDAGGVYPVDLVGIDYGPLVVTAVDLGEGPMVRCPDCRGTYPLQADWLGRSIPCCREGCAAALRINRHVAGSDLSD